MADRRKPGNINLFNRPPVPNPQGGMSTVNSMSFRDDPNGPEILIPTVVGRHVVPDEEAIAHYHQTGEHLGIFPSVAEANETAERIHRNYAAGAYAKPPSLADVIALAIYGKLR